MHYILNFEKTCLYCIVNKIKDIMEKTVRMYNVEISCGGGVGGSRWEELMYLNPSDVKALLDGNITFISGEAVKTGKTKMIGTRWIVTIEEA